LFHCETPEQLEALVKQFYQDKQKFILIGGGSNLVVSDQGLPLYVVRYISQKAQIKQTGLTVTVSGSTVLDDLALFCVKNSLTGLNYTSGIPGTVAGAVVGNAGAWGKQMGDVLSSVKVISPDGKVKDLSAQECGFTYRHSSLKESLDIVLSASFALSAGSVTELEKEREDILKLRAEKHPHLDENPCAGSFFRNIEPTSKAGKRQAAGWFLEEAGGKSLSVGGAKIFEKHANIIVKGQGCTAQNVHDLSVEMKRIVKEKFGLDLMREVRFVGEFDTAEKNREVIW
jgi:UDP-N-acetylmuramate dehydrogenase